MTGMDVDPEKLRGKSPQFDAAADAIRATFEKLNGVLQAEGDCWGSDEAGQTFAQDYLPASQDAEQGFTSMSETLGQVRSELDATAQTWDSTDQGSAANLGQLK